MQIGRGMGMGVVFGLGGGSGGGTPSPSPSFNRAYTMTTDYGVIQSAPPEMTTSNGPYYPHLMDTQDEVDFPADYAIFYSTDHDTGIGGIYLTVGRIDGAEPTGIKWLDYTAAVTVGWFDSVASKPSANPIISTNAAGFEQIETPTIIKVGSTWRMHIQSDNVTGYRYNQATIEATSTDLLNWTMPGSRSTLKLTIPDTDCIGDGHTGYSKPGPNPFPDLINPSTSEPWVWLSYSLAAGTAYSCSAQWGSDDGINWTRLANIHPVSGLLSDFMTDWRTSWLGIDTRNIRAKGDGTFIALTHCTAVGSGGDIIPGGVYELTLDNLGRDVVAEPVALLMPDGAGYNADRIQTPSVLIDGSDVMGVYVAQEDGVGKPNTIGFFRGTINPPAQVTATPLRPTPSLDKLYDFHGETSLPAGVTSYLAGTPTGQLSFGAYGLGLRFRGGASLDSEVGIFEGSGYTPSDYEYLDFIANELGQWVTNGLHRQIWIGFASQKDISIKSQTEYLAVGNRIDPLTTGAQAGPLVKTNLLSTTRVGADSERHSGAGFQNTNQTAKRALGVRLYPSLDRAIVLGESGVELEEMDVPVGWDWSQTLYPFISGINMSSSVNTFEGLGSIRVSGALA